MKSFKLYKTAALLSLVLFLQNCSSDAEDVLENNAEISIKILSARSDLDAVFIDLKEVHLKVIDDETNPQCWLRLPNSQSGIFNLLDIEDSIFMVAGAEVDPQMIYDVKLVLGDNNYIIKDGQRYNLHTNIVLQQDLKQRFVSPLEKNKNYIYAIDFDVDASIYEGHIPEFYILEPKINLLVE